MNPAARAHPGLGGAVVVSILLHAAALMSLFVLPRSPSPVLPPTYRVDLVAAPPGPREIGVVRDVSPTTPATGKAPPKADAPDPVKAAPIKPPARAQRPSTRATPNLSPNSRERVDASQAPTAGGGERGGAGTDVATVRTEGIRFPFPGYLDNIVRQVARNFSPRNPGALKAEVSFFIRRDGSVTGIRVAVPSGNFAFDLEAQGAVEAAARAFGPLPADFPDEVLPVTFSFDPARLR